MTLNPYQPTSDPNPNEPPQPIPNPYEQPMPNPYAPTSEPIQNLYQNPNEQASGRGPFGAPGYQNTSYGSQTPLTLGQAIQGLPNQYIKILTKPGAQSFAEEQGKADWGIIWIQLLFMGILATIIGFIKAALGTALTFSTSGGNAGATYAMMSSFAAGGASTFSIISVIIGFFVVVGVQYLLARGFGGTGDFKQQAYSYLLFSTPLNVIGYLLGLIPFFGFVASLALGIYGLVLNVFSIMAVHRLSGGKATAVVLIPIAAIILLLALCTFAFIALIYHAATTSPSY